MKRLLALTILSLIFSYVKAQYRSQELGIQTDNDSYLMQGSDRYYTNGIFIHYRTGLYFDEGGKLANKVLGFEIGQKMYNPQSASISIDGVSQPQFIDRPFAGYLYAASTYNLMYKKESNIKMGLELGIVGPSAYGRQVQEFIHNTFGFYPPDGWQYQIRNKAVINLSGEYTKLLFRAGFVDMTFDGYANAGTAFIGAGLGPIFRLGRFNKLFNTVITGSTVMHRNGIKANDQEFYFYYKPLVNLVAKDVTVTGSGTPKPDEVTGTLEHLMISNELGGAFNSGDRWTIDLAAIFHTKDTKEMVKSHQWGSLTVMYHFL